MSFSLSLLGEILIEESSELLGNPKALIPIKGSKDRNKFKDGL